MNNIEKLSKSIINELKANANQKDRDGARYYFKEPNVLNNLGIKMQHFNNILKSFKSDINNLTADECRELADYLVKSEIDEAMHIALRILKSKSKKDDKDKLFALLKSWLDENRFQNWALIDLCSTYVLSYCMEDKPKIREELFKYSDSEIMWHRRISIVGYVNHAKKGKYLDEFYKTAEKLVYNKEDLMQKAVGWILRNAGDADKNRLLKFIDKHGKKMGRTTLRYAIEHMPAEERKVILEATRA